FADRYLNPCSIPSHIHVGSVISGFESNGESFQGLTVLLDRDRCPGYIVGFFIIESAPYVRITVQDYHPFFYPGNGEQGISTSFNLLISEHYVFEKGDLCCLIGPGTPHFVKRYECPENRPVFFLGPSVNHLCDRGCLAVCTVICDIARTFIQSAEFLCISFWGEGQCHNKC